MKDLKPFFKEHRETLVVGGASVLAAVLLTLFLIGPKTRQIAQLQNEISMVKGRIVETIPGSYAGKPLEEIILEKQKELKRAEESLPHEERISEILKNLSRRAAELGVTVVSIRPQPPKPYPTEEAPLQVEGKICRALPIQVQIECSYRTLGKYLESLTESFPSLVTVDDLKVEREEGKLPNLKITLLITSYVFESN